MKTGPFDKCAFGTLGLETTLGVLIHGFKLGMIRPQRFVEVFSSKPAEFLRLPPGLGKFTLGAPFHAVWVDVHAPATVYTEDSISSLSKNSCFLGSKLPGKILGAFHEKRAFRF
jgi:dihydroorotase-like cyclic amidohydrolase